MRVRTLRQPPYQDQTAYTPTHDARMANFEEDSSSEIQWGLIVEELVQTLREQGLLTAGISRLTDLRLPTTVQGVLAARMDRLPAEEKALLQTLAVIGREFTASLLRKVVIQPEADLHRLLARLQAAEFVYEQPAFLNVEYIFKRALTQEVAYNSLLIERRKTLHERTAQAMEEVYRARLEDHYSELAYHYSRSGNTQKAVDYLQLTGQQAVQRSAHADAIMHLTTALELLKTLPDTPERDQQELMLQITLGVSRIVIEGYASSGVERAYTRARELCRQVGETPQLFPVLRGLWVFYITRAEYGTAHGLGEQLMRIAQNVQDPALLVEAHFTLGETYLFVGELIPAQVFLEQGIRLYDPQRDLSHAFLYGFDPGAACLLHAAQALWLLGYPDQALKKGQEALTLAQELSHPPNLAFTLSLAAKVYQFRRERRFVQNQIETALAISTKQEFPYWLAFGAILRGWALAEEGRGEEGITQMRRGLAAYRATGGELIRTYFLALLAEAYGEVGQPEEGLNVLAEALTLVDKTKEHHYEAELYRLRGELTLQQSQVPSSEFKAPPNPQPLTPSTQAEAEAEAYFLKAIDIAQQQQAKSLELRAATSLARLWQHQGKTAEAHQMLSDIYNWFTEGFDTKDLQEAQALIEALRD